MAPQEGAEREEAFSAAPPRRPEEIVLLKVTENET